MAILHNVKNRFLAVALISCSYILGNVTLPANADESSNLDLYNLSCADFLANPSPEPAIDTSRTTGTALPIDVNVAHNSDQEQLIDSNSSIQVAEILIRGSLSELGDIVRQAIQTQAGELVSLAQLGTDRQALLDTGYFSHVQVTQEETSDGIRVNFIVQPYPELTNVQIDISELTSPHFTLLAKDTIPLLLASEYCNKVINVNQLRNSLQQHNLFLDQGLIDQNRDQQLSQDEIDDDPYVSTDELILKGIHDDGTVILEATGRVIEDIQIYTRDSTDEEIEVPDIDWSQSIIQALEIERGSRFSEIGQKIPDEIRSLTPYKNINIYIKYGENPGQIILILLLQKKWSSADIAYNQAEELQNQGTSLSLREAVTKYEDSFNLFQESNQAAQTGQTDNLSPSSSYAEFLELLREKIAEYNRIHIIGQENSTSDTYLSPDGISSLDISQAISFFSGSSLSCNGQFLDCNRTITNPLIRIAEIYNQLGEFWQSLNYYDQALSILQASNQQDKVGELQIRVADIYATLGQSDQANVYNTQALSSQLARLSRLSSIDQVRNNQTEEINPDTNSLVIWEDMAQHALSEGDLEPAASYLRMAGVTARHTNPQDAIQHLNQARQLFNQVGNKAGEAVILIYLSGIYDRVGQEIQAVESYEQALTLFEDIDYQISPKDFVSFRVSPEATRGDVLASIAELSQKLNQPQQAVDFLKRALVAYSTVPLGQTEAALLRQIAWIYHEQLEEPKLALEYLEHAREISRVQEDKHGEIEALVLASWIYLKSLNQPQQAIEYLEQSLQIAQSVGDLSGEATALTFEAVVLNQLGDRSQPLEYINRALILLETTGDRSAQVEALTFKGAFLAEQGNLDEAIAALGQATNILESFRGDIKVEDLASSFIGQQIDVYDSLIQLLWETERYPEAFDVMEQSRARAFLSQLANGKIDLRSQTDTRLLEHERLLKSEITRLNQQLLELRSIPLDRRDAERIAGVENQLGQAQQNYETVLTDIRVQSPAVASLVNPQVLSLKDIQQQISPDTTLVEYYVSEDRVLAFVITRDSMTPVVLNVGQQELAEQITLFRDFNDPNDPNSAELQQLYQWLIDPLKSHLTTTNLIVVPHGVLHYLPFSALKNGDRYLGDDYVISLLPSANTLSYLPQQHDSSQNTLLALGNPATPEAVPTLLNANDEVEAIANLFGTHALIGPSATEGAIWSDANEVSILHVAAHGEYNPVNPLFSTLYLAPDDQYDGRLEVHEIYGLDLSQATNLVVLSACQTNIGELSQGDEVVGLSRAFIYTGVPNIISSLWDVDDGPTSKLMSEFYTHLKDGMSAAEALQQAQQAIREDYPHPYFWAAFSITGSTKR